MTVVRTQQKGVIPDEIELQAMARYKEKDARMDLKADIIAQKAEEWKRQAQALGQKQEQVVHQINMVDKEVQKTNKVLDTQNTRLKGILVKYRAPSKFCLDVAMFLVLVALVTVIIGMV